MKIKNIIEDIKVKTYAFAKCIIKNETNVDEYLIWFNSLPAEFQKYAADVFVLFEQYIIKAIDNTELKRMYDERTARQLNEI